MGNSNTEDSRARARLQPNQLVVAPARSPKVALNPIFSPHLPQPIPL